MLTIINNYVYEVTDKKKLLKSDESRINLSGKTTQINTLTNIPITYQVFDLEQQEYITDESINKTVDIYLDDALVDTEDIIDGIGNIAFNSEEVGTFKIKVENTECEVVANG